MTTLAGYQHHVATSLGEPESEDAIAHGIRLRGAAIMRWSVHQWAEAQLRDVCPLTSNLLLLCDRYARAVAEHLARPGRTAALHPWGLAFLDGLAEDADPLVAAVARLEREMTAPIASRRPLPDPWVWTRPPESVLLALACGADPRGLPVLDVPVRVRRDGAGRLVSEPG